MIKISFAANEIEKKEGNAFTDFRDSLQQSDQMLLDSLLARARQRAASIGLEHALPLEAVLLAMLLEQQREIEQLKNPAQPAQSGANPSRIRNWYVNDSRE